MNSHKNGDFVRVKEWEEMIAEGFAVRGAGDAINVNGTFFLDVMRKYCGGVFEVCGANGENCHLRNDDGTSSYCFFVDGMLAVADSTEPAPALSMSYEQLMNI